jgi:hypothetical protein
MRLFRAYRSACLVYIFSVFVPVQLMGMANGNLSALRTTMYVLTFALIFGMSVIRRRATARIRSTLAVNDADASRLLNTPAWRTSAWRRPATAPLLASSRASTAPREAAAALQDDGATRVAVTGRSSAP